MLLIRGSKVALIQKVLTKNKNKALKLLKNKSFVSQKWINI